MVIFFDIKTLLNFKMQRFLRRPGHKHMKHKIYEYFFWVTIITFLISCKKENEACKERRISATAVSKVTGPATGIINQSIIFEVEFAIPNGCINFDSFSENTVNNVSTIFTNIKSEGCICTAIYRDEVVKYSFKRSTAGTYVLIFKNNGGADIEKQITIQ